MKPDVENENYADVKQTYSVYSDVKVEEPDVRSRSNKVSFYRQRTTSQVSDYDSNITPTKKTVSTRNENQD